MRVFAASFWQEAVRIAHTPVDFLLLTLFPLVMLGAMAAMMWGGTLTNLPVVIVDQDGGALARTITRNIDATPYLEVVAQTPQRARHWPWFAANRPWPSWSFPRASAPARRVPRP